MMLLNQVSKSNAEKHLFPLAQVPRLPGVGILSTSEIESDLKEMIQSGDQDTDSDSSVKSKDILVSKYPVKPRKTLKIVPKELLRANNQQTTDNVLDEDSDWLPVALEEALTFVKKITMSRKEFMDNEQQREMFETIAKSCELAKSNATRLHLEQKQEQEAYFHLLQGALLRSLHTHAHRSRQVNLLLHVLQALKANRCSLEEISSWLSSTSTPSSTQRFRIKSSRWSSNCSVELFVGQLVRTSSYGLGRIINIDATVSKSVTIRLFDKECTELTCSLVRAAEWIKTTDVEEEINRWELGSIHTLLSQLESTEERDLICLSDSRYQQLQALTHHQQQSISDGDETDGDEDMFADSNSVMDDVEDDSNSTEDNKDIESHGKSSKNSTSEDANNDVHHTRSNKSHAVLSSTSAQQEALELDALFPLSTKSSSSSSELSRKSVRRTLNEDDLKPLDTQRLPIAWTSTASLDQLVHSYLGSKSTCFDAAKRSLIADSSALSNQDVLTSYSVAALGFSGDLNAMESELNALIEKKRSIQLEQSRVYKQIERSRMQTAQTSANISSVRLGMFTRRIAHRNHLGSHGIVVTTVPIATINNGKSSTKQSTVKQSTSSSLVNMSTMLTNAVNMAIAEENKSNRTSRSKVSKQSTDDDLLLLSQGNSSIGENNNNNTNNNNNNNSRRLSSRLSTAVNESSSNTNNNTDGRSSRSKKDVESVSSKRRLSSEDAETAKDATEMNSEEEQGGVTTASAKKKVKRRRY